MAQKITDFFLDMVFVYVYNVDKFKRYGFVEEQYKLNKLVSLERNRNSFVP